MERITERKRAEEARRDSEELKSRLLAASEDCIKVLDLEGRLLSMNEGGMQALEICEFAPFADSSWIDFWQGEDREAAQAAVEKGRNGGTGRFVGYFATAVTKQPRWWDVVVSPIRDAEGKPERLLAVSRDITKHKLNEEALREAHLQVARSEERRRTLLEINNAIITNLTQDALLHALCEALRGVVPVDRASMTLYEPSRDTLRILAVERQWRTDFFQVGVEIGRTNSHLGWAFDHQRPLVRRDLETEWQFPTEQHLIEEGIRSYCVAPLILGGKGIGTLNVGSLSKNRYSESDAELLSDVGSQVALAVRNMRSYEEIAALKDQVAHTAERRRTLLEINNAIITNLTQEALFRSVSEALQRVIPFNRAALTIYNPERGTFRFLALESRFESDYFRVGLEYDRKESVSAWVFDHQQAVVRHDLEKEQEYPNDRRLLAEGINSYCVVPLAVGGRSIGTLNLGSETKGQYSEADAEFLQEVGNQVALAVENMHSYEKIAALNTEVARSEERWRAVFENSAIGVSLQDVNGRFLAVNRAYEKMLGYTEEELRGLSFLDVTKEDDRESNWALATELLEGKRERYQVEKQYRRKDGSLLWVRNNVSLVPGTESIPRFLLVLSEDITKRKRAEEALREAEAELAHVTRLTTMGELAASIAHEVNQPLAAIVTNGSACLRMLSGESPDLNEVREAVADMIRDGKRASEVIARIRALFKKQQAQKAPLAINEVIEEALVLTRSAVERNGVLLRPDLGDDLPPILGDRVQLQQVVLNLIVNAIEAMSSVTDRPRQLRVVSHREGANKVLVAVRDSGSGLDPANIDRFFDAFYTTKPGGIGMGLSISRSIIEAHGGRLWAVPNEGPGATFQFALPVGARNRP
jgi:PAS domain S-box-containing protein